MRSDFGRVIIDCYRGGLHISAKKAHKGRWRNRLNDYERSDRRGPMSRSGGTKYFCDRLSPLRRYLEKQVGRPWDKVWAEICAHVPADGIMQQHVRNHVFDFVLTTTMLIDDRIFVVRNWVPEPLDELRSYRALLYVCPRTGLVRRARHLRPVKREPPIDPRISTADGRSLERIDGHWFIWERRVVRVSVDGYTEKREDWVKRQLSRKEISRLVPRSNDKSG